MLTSYVRHDHRERHRYRCRLWLVSMGVIIAFLLAALVIGGWWSGWQLVLLSILLP